MPYLPLQLNYGLIAMYNVSARKSSIRNIKAPDGFNWGTIYQISPYGIPSYRTVGQSCLFSGKDIVCTLVFAHKGYLYYRDWETRLP